MFKHVFSYRGAHQVRSVLTLSVCMFRNSPVRLASKAASSAAMGVGCKDDYSGEKCAKKAEDSVWSDGSGSGGGGDERLYGKQSDVTKRLRVMLKAELRDGMEIAKHLQMPTRTFENLNTLTYVEYKPQRRSECVRSQPKQSWTNVEVGRRLGRNTRPRMDNGNAATADGHQANNVDNYKLTSKTVNSAEQTPKDAKSFEKSSAKQMK